MPSNRRRRTGFSLRLRSPTAIQRIHKRSRPSSTTPVPHNGSAVAPMLAPLNSKPVVRNPSHPPIITSSMLTVTLPVPPSINHQYASVNGRRLLSSAGRSYKTYVGQQVWLVVAQSPARCSLRDRLQSGPLALTIRFFFASALRRDLDGGLKIAQDAVCEGLGLNDNRIVETHLYKQVDKADPRIELSLSFLQSPDHSD
ncbi:MAG: RusA family crossover junction endodeoxyribonuclease [Nitrospira sp. LK70]|nr:RusA family crossover junction endodeoxyribonuclease [Nitrospira sp. LK70]